MQLPRLVGLAGLVLIFEACGSSAPRPDAGSGSHTVKAADYAHGCDRDSDCILVAEGTIGCCGLGSCPSAAIATSAHAAYQADVSARRPTCNPEPPCIGLSNIGEVCGGPVAACVEGTCALLTCETVGCARGALCQKLADASMWGCVPFPARCVTAEAMDAAAFDACQCLAAAVDDQGGCSGGDATCATVGGGFMVSCVVRDH